MDITTIVLAIWGAVVSTILAGIKIWDFSHDRPKVIVEMKFGGIKAKISTGQRLLFTTPDKIQPYIALRARNKGRRSVMLTSAGMRLSNQINLGLIPYAGELPHDLKEGAEHTVLFNLEELKQGFKDEQAESLEFGWFQDGTGRIYKGKLTEIIRQALMK